MESNARSYRVLAVTGVLSCLFFVMAFFTTDVAPDGLAPSTAQLIQSLLASICASFLFLFVLDAGYLLLQSRRRRMFRAFFGDIAGSARSAFVYPDFELTHIARQSLAHLTEPIYMKRCTYYPGVRFIDVPHIIASNDLLAIVIMASRLGRLLRESPTLLTDGQACAEPTKSLMSFGLTSNAVTELYLQTDMDPLFRIIDDPAAPKLIIMHDSGPIVYGRDDTGQHGLIMRYRPDPLHYPRTFWFICAGLAAAGTPAAAWDLSHNWRRYHRRFKDRDFVVIFKTSNEVASYLSIAEVDCVTR